MAVVFMSYSHKDESLRDQLEAHLALLKNQGLIEAWHDRRILAGAEVDDAIFDKLEVADVILLLVSSDFISSQYCYSREMMRAIQRHEAGEAQVVPVILRHCDWHGAPFGKLMALPKDGRPVTSWPDRDEAFSNVALQIRRLVEARGPTREAGAQRSGPVRGLLSPSEVTAAQVPQFRSSNLRLKKDFSDKEKADFQRETFEFICRFFENSLDAISQRYADVEGKFERIDSRRMAAFLYRNGRSIAECSVRLEGMGSRDMNIGYSNNASANAGSYNEMLTVEAGDHALYMKPLGMAISWNDEARIRQLSEEGAAEYLWDLFIQRAQH